MTAEKTSSLRIHPATVQLLRFPFSFFLMPVYWFALSQVVDPNKGRAILIFLILHVLVYPSSNGYNSYMDRDETPIGGIAKPLAPTRQLFYISIGMDLCALLLSTRISGLFAAGILVYILASRAYSYRGIRLKQYPVIGYLTVVLCQGTLVFFLVFHGSHPRLTTDVPLAGLVSAALLIGGFYPLTQIYQHEADRKDGVRTISALLGYRGTFVFTGIVYTCAMLSIAWFFLSSLEQKEFRILATCMLPILVYYLSWAIRVWKDPSAANFSSTMKMNIVASVCANLGFILVLSMQ